MKSVKSVLKLVGAILAVAGVVMLVIGCLDELHEGCRKLSAYKARREEMKDYVD